MCVFNEEFHVSTDVNMHDDWCIVLQVMMQGLQILCLVAELHYSLE